MSPAPPISLGQQRRAIAELPTSPSLEHFLNGLGQDPLIEHNPRWSFCPHITVHPNVHTVPQTLPSARASQSFPLSYVLVIPFSGLQEPSQPWVCPIAWSPCQDIKSSLPGNCLSRPTLHWPWLSTLNIQIQAAYGLIGVILVEHGLFPPLSCPTCLQLGFSEVWSYSSSWQPREEEGHPEDEKIAALWGQVSAVFPKIGALQSQHLQASLQSPSRVSGSQAFPQQDPNHCVTDLSGLHKQTSPTALSSACSSTAGEKGPFVRTHHPGSHA